MCKPSERGRGRARPPYLMLLFSWEVLRGWYGKIKVQVATTHIQCDMNKQGHALSASGSDARDPRVSRLLSQSSACGSNLVSAEKPVSVHGRSIPLSVPTLCILSVILFHHPGPLPVTITVRPHPDTPSETHAMGSPPRPMSEPWPVGPDPLYVARTFSVAGG